MDDCRKVTLRINGKKHRREAEPRTLLVYFIRDTLHLTGTHVGCDTGHCGACTVIMNGVSIKSCMTLAVAAQDADILTVEGLADGDNLHPLQESFWENHGLQCGYCTPGMLMSAYFLLKRTPNPTTEEIAKGLEGNLCMCTGYENILRSIRAAIEKMSASSTQVIEA
jgi:aerobic carbon-monoxide dehydrogenase small subunit